MRLGPCHGVTRLGSHFIVAALAQAWRQQLRRPCAAAQPRAVAPCSGAAAQRASACRASTSATASVVVTEEATDIDVSPGEVDEYVRRELARVDRPTAKKLKEHLDLSQPLGIPAKDRSGRGRGLGQRAHSLQEFMVKQKRLHPTKVLLVRVGEFYETAGIDAVLLVQWAGLNPMGNGVPPKAGCPVRNLRRTLHDLVVDAGLSVVVCEEAATEKLYGRPTKAKERYIAGVVTPASPHYTYGLIDEEQVDPLEPPPPLLGLASSTGGYTVMKVDCAMMTCRVTTGLTEEAVAAQLHEGGLVPPLYLHINDKASPSAPGPRSGGVEGDWAARVAAATRSIGGAVRRYRGDEPVLGLLQLVARDNGLGAHVEWTMLEAEAGERPRPTYQSTACQLGLLKTRGIPGLLDALLPPDAPAMASAWLWRLLMQPPPPRVGGAVRDACRELGDLQFPLPEFPATLRPQNIALKLRKREANDRFFRELRNTVAAVAGALRDERLGGLCSALLLPTCEEAGIQLDLRQLEATCACSLAEIDAVVHNANELWGLGSAAAALGDDDDEDEDEDQDEEARGAGAGVEVLRRFFNANEDFKEKIQAARLADQYSKVEAAGMAVEAALRSALERGAAQARAVGAEPPTTKYDVVNNAVWLRWSRARGVAAAADGAGLQHPKDRNGKVLKDVYCTPELYDALDAYRVACAEAWAGVRRELKALAGRLQAELPGLVGVTWFSAIARALDLHVATAREKAWALPEQLPRPADPPPDAAPPFEATGLWPYWLDGAAPSTVRNSFSMRGLLLLTGPNMAGKSTLMRSSCALALLAAAGLHAPVEAACVPWFDAFMLRNFSSDSPLEGKSSFAMEMTEMRYLLQDVSPHSLVLIDELGKGTEVEGGTAIAGALLEELAAQACRGVFATHLHRLLDLPLELPGVTRMCMETRGEGSGRVPTLRMVSGESRESLALPVATQCGLPERVVARAARLYEMVRSEGRAALRVSAGSGAAAAAAASAANGVADTGSARADAHAPAARQADGGAGSRGSTCGGPAIEDALLLLQRAAASVAAATGVADGADAAALFAAVHVVRPGQKPPPSVKGASAAYVLRRPDGWFYVGQTDDLRQRLDAHRKRSGRVKGGPGMEAGYLLVPAVAAGASFAAAVEAAAIKELRTAGFWLLSDHDAGSKRLSPNAGECARANKATSSVDSNGAAQGTEEDAQSAARC